MIRGAFRWFVLPALVLAACLVLPQVALAETITPAACNVSLAAGASVTCDVDVNAERAALFIRQDGSTGATDFLPTVTSVDPSGGKTGGLNKETSAFGTTGGFTTSACQTGTGMCAQGSLLLAGAPLRVTLLNNTATARQVYMAVHVPAGAAAASPEVEVTNWPATQAVTVGNWPATQPVSGSVSVSNFPAIQDVNCETGCGGAGGGGEVALSVGDAQRLDLIWVGIFLMGGVSLGLTVGGWLKRDADRWTFPRG